MKYLLILALIGCGTDDAQKEVQEKSIKTLVNNEETSQIEKGDKGDKGENGSNLYVLDSEGNELGKFAGEGSDEGINILIEGSLVEINQVEYTESEDNQYEIRTGTNEEIFCHYESDDCSGTCYAKKNSRKKIYKLFRGNNSLHKFSKNEASSFKYQSVFLKKNFKNGSCIQQKGANSLYLSEKIDVPENVLNIKGEISIESIVN